MRVPRRKYPARLVVARKKQVLAKPKLRRRKKGKSK